jgi:IK cytokine
VLVKGLDFSLLARIKAQLSSQSTRSAEEIESELEKVFSTGGGGGAGGQSRSPSPAQAPQEDPALAAAAAEPTTTTAGKKRSRDELIAQLKAKREAELRGQEAAEFERAKAMGKFKAVGEKKKAPGAAAADDKGKGKAKEVEGKKKRKKKKVRTEEETAQATTASSTTGISSATRPADEEDGRVEQKEAREGEVVPESIQQQPPLPPPPTDEPDDVDIFDGAGDYDLGLSDSEDEEGEEKREKTKEREEEIDAIRAGADTGSQERPTKRFKIFDDDDVSADPLPPPVPLPSRSVARPAGGARPEAAEGDEVEDQSRSRRLEGLSTTNLPSVKELLELDRAAEKEEARKARKEKYKNKAKKELTDADKVNRDWQRLQTHLAKSEKAD